jgi:hypothetical protein
MPREQEPRRFIPQHEIKHILPQKNSILPESIPTRLDVDAKAASDATRDRIIEELGLREKYGFDTPIPKPEQKTK